MLFTTKRANFSDEKRTAIQYLDAIASYLLSALINKYFMHIFSSMRFPLTSNPAMLLWGPMLWLP